ncbi:hypothetical protein GCK72_025377 [Caenorhabditis remanei]|uniref:Uncharacterized protein n=1 Tax=Caenorhabditis remanei TaxID=31234 RepID=A0A6A5G1S5_CAERE|nr:hypothetical protein GCK72_025377 [Caenorhabditis remanei]KAF1748910.1 hypothetical protein GCK72_025377 [Caenorhabditis remanei]
MRETSLGTLDFFKQPDNATDGEKKQKRARKKQLKECNKDIKQFNATKNLKAPLAYMRDAKSKKYKKVEQKLNVIDSIHDDLIKKKTEKIFQKLTNGKNTGHRSLKWDSGIQKFKEQPTETEINNASQLLRKRPLNISIFKLSQFHRFTDSKYLISKHHDEYLKMKNGEKVFITGQKRPLSTAKSPTIVTTAKRQKTGEQCEQADRTTRYVGVLSSNDENNCVSKDNLLSTEFNWQHMVNNDQILDSSAEVSENTIFINDTIDEFENHGEFNLLEFIDSSYENEDSTSAQVGNHVRDAKPSKEIYQQELEFLENQFKF